MYCICSFSLAVLGMQDLKLHVSGEDMKVLLQLSKLSEDTEITTWIILMLLGKGKNFS